MTISFQLPSVPRDAAAHHGSAAAGNLAVTKAAMDELRQVLSGRSDRERILLKAAAGAGKSFALKLMVDEALQHPRCTRVGVTAYTNKQIHPLAEDLGRMMGRDAVVLCVAKGKSAEVDRSVHRFATVVEETSEVPHDAQVVIATTHKLEGMGRHLLGRIGPAYTGAHLFDVLFIDEAWQLALHRYRRIDKFAPVDVGVGDVGQLPPLEIGENPWRGDRGYNPYRAWPTAYEDDAHTWAQELPAVWRPTEAQLALWRSFYTDWKSLTCVAGPGDRRIEIGPAVTGPARDIWTQVGTGTPTLVELSGLRDSEAPDVDLPLMETVEGWLDALLGGGFVLHEQIYDKDGVPEKRVKTRSTNAKGRKLIAMLATRNQAVDDAQDMVDRLIKAHDLDPESIEASTVDKWQGQTNAITIAVHPLSGASKLDDFNSAFGRLAVICTRATHGLLVVAREGLDELLSTAPARPGTPLGEPGVRQLPRQTHERILQTFARGRVNV